ncbi:hypothetical protein ACQPXM_14705 [Kribbella sp. CA-253562]
MITKLAPAQSTALRISAANKPEPPGFWDPDDGGTARLISPDPPDGN